MSIPLLTISPAAITFSVSEFITRDVVKSAYPGFGLGKLVVFASSVADFLVILFPDSLASST